MRRKEVIIDEREAARWVKDGMTIAIGGFINSSHPMAIVRQIIKNGIKDLTVVGTGSSGLEIDLLIGAGCVKKVIAPYVGAEGLAGIAPFFRAMAQRGELDIWECDEGIFYTALRAASHLLPFLPWRTGVGTSFPKLNPELKVFQDPLRGETLIAVPAIHVDVAILQAGYADPYGNIQYVGSSFSDIRIYEASEKCVVQVEKIIPNEFIRKEPEKTVIHGVDAVVRALFGSHPYASPGFYVPDKEHIGEYVDAANAFLKRDDMSLFEAYLDKYVRQPETHADYLETIGIKRLLSLYEW